MVSTQDKSKGVDEQPIMAWFYIEDKHPPFIVFSEESEIEQNTITESVIAQTKDHGEVVTYHDGDVWCYHDYSGCPQYEVIKWRSLPANYLLVCDGLHTRVSA